LDTLAFLRHVLPHTGPYCIAIAKVYDDGRRTYWHYPAEDTDEAAAIARQRDREGENTFFAVGALIKAQEWVLNEKRGEKEFRTKRTAENVRALRSYIFDIDAGGGRAYETTEHALAHLKEFCNHYSLPRPTLVQSGNGLHVYWTLTEEVPTATWKMYGASLKQMAATFGLKIDPGRTADAASVLRVVGTRNHKYDDKPQIYVLRAGDDIPTDAFHAILSLNQPEAASNNQLLLNTAAGMPDLGVNSNTDRREPLHLNPKRLMRECGLFKYACDNQSQVSEPAWHGAIMLARYIGEPEQGRAWCHEMSRNDPRYSESHLNQKLDRLDAKNMGPTTCVKWQEKLRPDEVAICNACQWNTKITSPAELARDVKIAAPIVVPVVTPYGLVEHKEISPPPAPFVRTEHGIGMETANKQGIDTTVVFCQYDMYPVRNLYDERSKLAEDVRWCINLPHEGWVTIDIPHVPKNQLQLQLAKRGIMIDAKNIDAMEWFMTSYVRKLQQEIPREVAHSKMGWRPDGSFVVGDQLYRKNGVVEQHAMSHELTDATFNGMHIEGDFDAWKLAVQIYNRPGMEAYRCYLYSAFASIFYNMTGQVATVVSATGAGGVGKSTLLDVCASVWGDPKSLVSRGTREGSTRAAIEALADAMHHLPVMLDEITDRDAKEMADVIFNYSGGKGKIRSQARGGLRANTASWSNLSLVNANADEYARMSSIYRDSQPHMMRLIQLEFVSNGAVLKSEGDHMRLTAHENYGHAGRVFAEYCAQHHVTIKKQIQRYVAEADSLVGAKSEERFWTAWVASARRAAEIAYDLGILDHFPITADVQWMYQQVALLRTRVGEHITNADEMIAGFLDTMLPNTLTISAKAASNIDNVSQEPRGELVIRNEVDTGTLYVSRSALQRYCVDNHINMGRHLKELVAKGIVRNDNVRKVLGSGTKYAKGNVRCIEIDMARLTNKPVLVSTNPPAQPQPLRTVNAP
jgi:hypothetical protein